MVAPVFSPAEVKQNTGICARSALFTIVANPVPDALSEICKIACTFCAINESAASESSVGRSDPALMSSMPAAASFTFHSSRKCTLFASPGANTVPARVRLGIAAFTMAIMRSQSALACAPVTLGRCSLSLVPTPAATPEATSENTMGRSVILRAAACNAGVVKGTTTSGASSAMAATMMPSVAMSNCASRIESSMLVPST